MTVLNEDTARAILEAFHAAWSKGNVEGMLSWCHDDVTNFLNMGAADGGPLRLFGKAEMRGFLLPVVDIAESVTVPVSFTFRDNIGRAQIEAYIQHRKTRNVLSGTFRQVIIFEGFKIAAIEEFHDGAKMKAFWEMVAREEHQADQARETD
jgi:ketosteroid isomerase-like protein